MGMNRTLWPSFQPPELATPTEEFQPQERHEVLVHAAIVKHHHPGSGLAISGLLCPDVKTK